MPGQSPWLLEAKTWPDNKRHHQERVVQSLNSWHKTNGERRLSPDSGVTTHDRRSGHKYLEQSSNFWARLDLRLNPHLAPRLAPRLAPHLAPWLKPYKLEVVEKRTPFDGFFPMGFGMAEPLAKPRFHSRPIMRSTHFRPYVVDFPPGFGRRRSGWVGYAKQGQALQIAIFVEEETTMRCRSPSIENIWDTSPLSPY